MLDIVRDSSFGQIVNWASNGRLLPYRDQLSDYVVPSRYLQQRDSATDKPAGSTLPRTLSDAPTVVSGPTSFGSNDGDLEKHSVPAEVASSQPPSATYPWLVDFEENDPDRPKNWSSGKRFGVASLIMLLTFSVYIGSAIYTPSIPGIMAEFDIGLVGATSGLTLFVAAYGLGPMLFSQMQEIPRWGRNPVYIIGLALFVIFQIPGVLAKNVATILVFRFLSGFVGSPALATGGASMADIYEPQFLPVAIGAWAIGAVCGPIFGPVIGGFAAEGENWRWPLLELLWISGFGFVVLFFLLPETMESTILVRRAERLRKLTGNPLLKAPAEVDQGDDDKLGKVLKENVFRAFRLALEPALAVAHAYIALVYAIFYLWFESFPKVFQGIHGFSLGTGGLPYLTFVVVAVFTFIGYLAYLQLVIVPRMARNPNLPPEVWLEIALYASVFIPVSLFWFGWSARESVHWMVPLIGAALYQPGIFLAFQGIMLYVSMSYPRYAGPVLAGNTLFRSVFASVFPLFGDKFFNALTIGGGSSLLAGVSILMIPLLWMIMKYGPVLRARSKFAQA